MIELYCDVIDSVLLIKIDNIHALKIAIILIINLISYFLFLYNLSSTFPVISTIIFSSSRRRLTVYIILTMNLFRTCRTVHRIKRIRASDLVTVLANYSHLVIILARASCYIYFTVHYLHFQLSFHTQR